MTVRAEPTENDKFAAQLLRTRDRRLRRLMAGAYRLATYDVLPHDEALIDALLAHRDPWTAQPALRHNLAKVTDRRDTFAPWVGRLLAGGAPRAVRRRALLRSLKAWGPDALRFEDELAAIVLGDGDADPTDRRLALQRLIENDSPRCESLVRRTARELPTAHAMAFALRRGLFDLAVEWIDAAASGGLQWAPHVAGALAAMTGQYELHRAEDFARWLASYRRTGTLDEAVERGFAPEDADEPPPGAGEGSRRGRPAAAAPPASLEAALAFERLGYSPEEARREGLAVRGGRVYPTINGRVRYIRLEEPEQ